MTPHLWAKMWTHDWVQRTIKTNQLEWTEACRQANKAIIEAKTESWKEVFEGAITNTSGKDMWKAINALNSTSEANSPNKAMSQNSRTITDAKAKANIFVNHYARISDLLMTTKDHNLIREFKKKNWLSIYRQGKLLQTHHGLTYICHLWDEMQRLHWP